MNLFELRKDHKQTILWFVFMTFQTVVFLGTMQLFDGYRIIWNIDQTKLSFLIIILYFIGSLYMGWRVCHKEKDDATKQEKKDHSRTDGIWFIADNFLSLGMLGTVVGFIIMLTSVYAVDLSNTANYSILITNMLSGMGTALITTLTGLICSMMLKHQIVYYEGHIYNDASQ